MAKRRKIPVKKKAVAKLEKELNILFLSELLSNKKNVIGKEAYRNKKELEQLIAGKNISSSKKASKKKLTGKAKFFYEELQRLKNLPPKKKKRISKLARGILYDLNKLYRQKQKDTGFAVNNFNHIRSLLWKTYREDFKAYNDPAFISVVMQVYTECKALGGTCPDEKILEIYLKIKKAPKRPQPFLDPALFDPQPYFNIKDVEFALFEPYLWIVSPMIIPAPHEFIVANYYYHYNKLLDAPINEIEKYATEIRGKKALSNLSKKEETLIFAIVSKPVSSWSAQQKTEFLEIYAKHNEDATRGYNTYFKMWVDWCNDAMQAAYGGNPPSDKIFFRFYNQKLNEKTKVLEDAQEAVYNLDKERWEVTIIICNADGTAYDFGFKPTGQVNETEVWQQYVEPAPAAQPQTLGQPQDQHKEIEKQKAIANIKNTLKEIQEKSREIDKKEKEQEIRLFLLEQEKKNKEIDRLTKLAQVLRKNLGSLNKSLVLAKEMKDKKEAKALYAQIKKLTAELSNINEELIKINK